MADSSVNREFSEDDVKLLVSDSKLPQFWVAGESVITYKLLNYIFEVVDELNLSSTIIIKSVNMLCGHDIQSVIKQASNFRKKVRNLLKKNPSIIDEPVPELNNIKNTNSNTESVVDIIGPFCEGLNINRSLLRNVSNNKINFNLSNGAVLELDNERIKYNATWHQFADWVFFLSGGSGVKVNYSAIVYLRLIIWPQNFQQILLRLIHLLAKDSSTFLKPLRNACRTI